MRIDVKDTLWLISGKVEGEYVVAVAYATDFRVGEHILVRYNCDRSVRVSRLDRTTVTYPYGEIPEIMIQEVSNE